MAKGKAVKKYAEDEVGRYYVFEPLYKEYYNLGHPELEAMNEVLDELGLAGIHELCDRARMKCYEMDKEYWDAHQPEWAKSTKKSKYARMKKALNKLGGFTKEDDEEEESEEDSKEEETEVESEDEGEEKPQVTDEGESESDNLNESCKDAKSKKSLRTSKKKVKMRKAEEMPEDADDQQDINQKGSGNAGSELPEDADDVKEVNEKGSGNAGSELPEDADDAEDQKQAMARKNLMMRSRNKGMRKFSVTPGGSPNQESYIKRYNQAPTVRRAIDDHFGSSANKSFDEVQMLQDRIDAMNKSRRNTESNNVPMKLRKR